jgi:hypothetical protein
MSPTSLSHLPQSAADWAVLYRGLALSGHVPRATDARISPTSATFRAMYLDLAEVKAALDAAGVHPAQVTLYADVLSIPSGFTWVLADAALLVQARRLEVGSGASVLLDYRRGKLAQLVLFAAELSAPWTAQAVLAGQPAPSTFTLAAPLAGAGVQLALAAEGQPALTPLTFAQGLPQQVPAILTQALTNAFLFGSLLYDQQPPLALAIMSWVKNWAAQSPDWNGLFWRSSSLVALLSSQLKARENGATFVPYLTAAVYTELAEAFVAEAKDYEDNYLALNTQQVLTQQNIAQAQALADNAQYQSQYVQGLKAQAARNYANAQLAVDKALANFKAQEWVVRLVSIDFTARGLPEYERRVIVEAIFDLGKAVVTFVAAIGLMAVGQEEAAPAAAGAAVSATETVAQAATTGAAVAKQASALAAVMEKLKKLVEGLTAIYELANAVLKAAADVQGAQGLVKDFQAMDVDTDGADLSASVTWELFTMQVHGVLQEPIAKGISFAQDYQDALDVLVLYGQSLASAQLAAVQAGQEYARVLLQEQLAQQQQARLAAYVQTLQVGQQVTDDVMQQFFQRYLDAKESLLAALLNYRASYFYWALAPSGVRPVVLDPVGRLDAGLQQLTALRLDTAAALAHFDPPPATLHNKQVAITDPAFLDLVRRGKPATWAMPSDVADFLGLSRVRLTAVRAWLEGAQPQGRQKISLTIRTSGGYRDQFEDTDYLKRSFEYHVEPADNHQPNPDWKFDDGTRGYIELDGDVDNEVKYAYFQPTPFTEWTVSVSPSPLNAGLDLTGLSKVTLAFAGSAIGRAAQLQGQAPAPVTAPA